MDMDFRAQDLAKYFDLMDIKYLKKPSKFGANGYRPDFYLPDFVCFAEVTEGPYMKGKAMNNAENLVNEYSFPVIHLKTDPGFKYYEMLVPEDGDGKFSIKYSFFVIMYPTNLPPIILSNEKSLQEAK